MRQEHGRPNPHDRPVTPTLSLALDSGPEPVAAPPRGGLRRVRGKGLGRHVAEVEALAPGGLTDIIDTSRAAIATRLHLARLEVELNVARTTARPRQDD